MRKKMTKADLQALVDAQQKNLSMLHGLFISLRQQNEILHHTNVKLREEVLELKEKYSLNNGKR
ncbi:hypothetical protein [Flagellimonas algicola]|uniref:Transposase n=1 Tax=Flagellimonas algicola TaxID=2583815 RepID=A0ABY2WMZ6_9FLAO|nr:hypothetical protein [Allomuricauda algicola]TMU56258.1 hypothetical protein FGG15_01580 [Allomuricauda algicola]